LAFGRGEKEVTGKSKKELEKTKDEKKRETPGGIYRSIIGQSMRGSRGRVCFQQCQSPGGKAAKPAWLARQENEQEQIGWKLTTHGKKRKELASNTGEEGV